MKTLIREIKMNKYRLSDETRIWQWKNGDTTRSVTLRQIIATVDFNDVTAGTKGGWVDDERTLAQDGAGSRSQVLAIRQM